MVEKEILSAEEAVSRIKDGDVVMLGGFMGCGSPAGLLTKLRDSGKKDMTLVCNDCGWHNEKIEKYTEVAYNIIDKQFSKVITTHIGLNQEIQRQMIAGETEVELVPQGTLAERIRTAGAGLGGFLTPTGVGTEVEEGKTVIEEDGVKYLLEKPLKGNVAILRAAKADKAGNLVYSKSARNFNPVMATACDLVIVEADEIVEIGELDPECIVTPSVFVNILVGGSK
ncbi:MAG: 3-oxoacid CoA-transferase subunit A [Spirochaetales bacterium]|nr:3-oxoacid CoA-transferase subunit A [Spirochaetales bacterium]